MLASSSRFCKSLDQVLDRVPQVELDALEFKLAGLDPGNIEDVIEQAEQVVTRALRHVHVFLLLQRKPGLLQQAQHAQHAVQGRA